jgi:hypothetical protein
MELVIGLASCGWIMYTAGGVLQSWRECLQVWQWEEVSRRTKGLHLAASLLGTTLLLSAARCLWSVLP